MKIGKYINKQNDEILYWSGNENIKLSRKTNNV